MSKKKIIIIVTIILSIILITIAAFFLYNKWKIAHAKIIVELVDNLEVEVYSEVKLSSLIKSLNGKMLKDFTIDTKKVGEKTISFKYINEQNIEVPYSFTIKVVDKTPPMIYQGTSLTVNVGYTGNLAKELFCGDNYDDTPKCQIIGNYDYNVVGTYPLTYQGIDSSGNVSSQKFTLYVKKPSSGSSSTQKPVTQNFTDLVATYKKDNTKIGLDVSKWQGDINFQKVKDAGVEFVFIRVGTQRGIGGEYVLDPKFEQNIKGFQSVGIPVGVYFYSYANSKKAAKKEAAWILEQLKPYDLELEVAFDWENWSFYQEFNQSFYHLNEIAATYLDVFDKAGYKGLLYSSKNYLEKIWNQSKYPIWLAHYTKQTNYQGSYKYWQLCNNAKIPGISGTVDVNVMYN